MAVELSNFKKDFLLLKEIFMEASRIRNQSFLHHQCFSGEKGEPLKALNDLGLSPDYVDWDEAYYFGFAQQEYILNKYDWDIEKIFLMAADVNAFLDSGMPRIDYSGFPKKIDQEKIDKLVQSGINNIESLKNELDID